MGPSDESADGHEPAPATPRRRGGLGRLLGWSALLLLAALTIVAGTALYVQAALDRPGPLGEDRAVVIPRGASVVTIADLLADEGVIADPLLFRLGGRLLARERPLRAGEFAFAASISTLDAIRHLQDGATVVRRLTVPEGLTTPEVLALVAAAPGLDGEVPTVPGEGLLLPETYHYAWGDDRAEIVTRMRDAMVAALAELWPGRAPDLPFATPDAALTLASIVERETAVAAERPRIAAVFVNRLERGMRLQSDPTVAFALSDGAPLDRPLTRADLKVEHPYNTYVVKGLPPGPIANPGRASLAAVLNPADSDELYFVADGSGGHAFARTLEEHNRNVAKWRKVQRERNGG